MLYSEADRLKRRWRIVAGSLVLALVYMLLAAVPAYATTWPGPDDGSGNYAHCNLATYNSGGNGIISFNCQYTLGTGGAATTNTITDLAGGNGIDFGTWTHTCSGCTSGFSGTGFGPGWTGTNSAGHAYRDTTSAAKTDNTFTVSSFSTCNVQFSARGTNGIPATVHVPCVIDSVSMNTVVPLLPTNNYPGATSGPTLDANKGTSVCSRTLTDTAAMTGEFTSSRTGVVNATTTAYDWNWGDSTTHGTLQNQNHTYGALSTMPTNGWTATVTMTVTAASGHLFSDGSSSQTGTCSLRVDFLHPENMTSGSTGGSGTGDATLDSCIPSGWNIVNPIALIGGVGCILKILFIPSSTTVSNLGHLWDTATTHVPFSIVNDVVTYIPASLDDMRDGIAAYSPILGYNHDVGASVARSPVCDAGAGGINLCGTGGYPFFGTYFDIHGYAGCTTDCESGNAIPVAARTVLMFVITAMFIYACWRGAGEILK